MLMTELADLMDEEIAREVDVIRKLDPEKPEYARAIEALTKLYKERVGHYNSDMDDVRQTNAADKENEFNEERLKIEKSRIEIDRGKLDIEKVRNDNEKDRNDKEIDVEKTKISVDDKRRKHEKAESWSRFGVDTFGMVLRTVVEAGAIVVPVVFYGKWIKEGLEFEKTGTFTSTTLRTLIGKMKPNKT